MPMTKSWIVQATRSAALVSIILGLVASGCSAPPKKVAVHRQNQFLRCEPHRTTQRQMTRLINAARTSSRRCGSRTYPPAAKVRWNPRLADAAHRHARDMADVGRLSHTGSDGSSVGKRAATTGYRWQVVAENIAAGLETSEEVIEQWLRSPAHCRNIMEKNLSEIGAACQRNRSSRYGTYWTLVLGSPLK